MDDRSLATLLSLCDRSRQGDPCRCLRRSFASQTDRGAPAEVEATGIELLAYETVGMRSGALVRATLVCRRGVGFVSAVLRAITAATARR